MFRSRSVAIHLAKGVAGLALLAAAFLYASTLGWWALIPVAGAMLLFRGCPMCWTVGLIETVLDRRSACTAGSCASGRR
jgi:hypothetical protein